MARLLLNITVSHAGLNSLSDNLNLLYLYVVLLVLATNAASGRAVTPVDKGPRVAKFLGRSGGAFGMTTTSLR